MSENKVSRRGYYYDLNASPHEFKSPCGDVFKFPSEKKLEMYRRDITKELKRCEAFLKRNELENYLDDYVTQAIYDAVYRALYNKR